MESKTQCTCGGTIDALQRTGGIAGVDYVRTKCNSCGKEQIFHGQDAREVAAAIDASNQQPSNKELE